jgi:hypothetical protein
MDAEEMRIKWSLAYQFAWFATGLLFGYILGRWTCG